MFVFQGNDHDCGYASLKMLLADYNDDKNYLSLRKGGEKNSHYSFYDLIEIASENGLTLRGAHVVDVNELLVNCEGYFLASLIESEYLHLVCAKIIFKKYVFIKDPTRGKYLMTLERFMEEFSGNILYIDYQASNKRKCKDKRKQIINFVSKIPLFICQFFAFGFICLSLTSLATKNDFWVSVSCLVLSFVFQLIYELFVTNLLRKFDMKYLNFLNNKPIEMRSESLNILQKEKMAIIYSPVKIFTSILIVGFLITSLIFNGPIYILVGLILIGFLLVLNLIFTRFSTKISYDLEEKERKLINNSNLNVKSFVDDIYSYSSIINVKNKVPFLFAIVSSFVLSIMLDVKEINFVIYYFCIYLFLLENVDVIATSFVSKDKKKIEARFRDKF